MDDEIGIKIGMALFGGTLIALSSSLNYFFFGKITGLSGFLFYVVGFKFGPLFPLRMAFIIGMITVVDLFYNFYGRVLWGQDVLDPEEEINILSWIIGGILIGLGVRWSGGCTSGHGVCGLPRFSKRSLVAVCIFMAFGIATASINAVIGPLAPSFKINQDVKVYYNILPRVVLSLYQLAVVICVFYYLIKAETKLEKLKPIAYFIMGSIFGLGLLISGMTSRRKIIHFLALNKDWDPSLAFVMASAVGINLLTFQYTIKRGGAVFNQEIDLPDTYMDKGIYVGPALFGIGWALTGLCPGPALVNITVQGYCLLLVLLIFSGQALHDYLEIKFAPKTVDECNAG
ncbi:hypothetical protein SteCoe_1236 [Stentor coeruleus]|uniref:Sulphur transport domain-containing protein n=1 Tax=Stentor coeruleus TaxID=5963 RepID=A0A1R2D239_9CILI|nr:hypothetical protein SteCoe_1236 [Stentor coeruleus]